MNTLKPDKAREVYRLLAYGHGIRESARLAGVNRNTVQRYKNEWLRHRQQLQRAYDALWEGDGEGCDAITANLPDQMVIAMLDTWLDDQFDQPKSGYHAGYDDAETHSTEAHQRVEDA